MPGEQAAAQGRVCDDLDSELARGREDPDLRVLDVETEGRVLELGGGNQMCAAESRGRRFGEAEVFDFASPGGGEMRCEDSARQRCVHA